MLIIVPCQVKHSLSTSVDRGTSRWHRRAAPRFCTLRREIGFKVVNFDKSFLHRFLHKSHKISHRTVWTPKESKNNNKFKDEKRNKKPVPKVCWGQTLCQKIAFFSKDKTQWIGKEKCHFSYSSLFQAQKRVFELKARANLSKGIHPLIIPFESDNAWVNI